MAMNPYQTPGSSDGSESGSRVRFAIVVFLLVYVSSYMVLSRQGFAKADAIELEGLWFFTPEDGNGWRVCHYTCVIAYLPLVLIDNLMGSGREVTNEPTWNLSQPQSGVQHGIVCRDPIRHAFGVVQATRTLVE